MIYTRSFYRGVLTALIGLLLAVALWNQLGVAAAEAYYEAAVAIWQDPVRFPMQQGTAAQQPEANLPFLFAAFFVTWAAFFGYAFVMSRRQREMKREIEALATVLAEKERQDNEAEAHPESSDSNN